MKKVLLTVCVIYAVLSVLWNYVLRGFGKLTLVYIGFMLLPILGFYIKAMVGYNLSRHAVEYKKEVGEQKRYNREMQKQEFLRDYDARIKPLYTQGRSLFNLLLKQHKIHNYEIADLKGILNDRIGKYLDHYHNYKFKNDVNEIYVKMKNFHLNEYDWELILNYLHALEANEPTKVEKKTKEVLQ